MNKVRQRSGSCNKSRESSFTKTRDARSRFPSALGKLSRGKCRYVTKGFGGPPKWIRHDGICL